MRCADVARSYDAYRFGDGILEVGGSEPALRDYITALYGDCRVKQRGAARSPTVRCTVGPTEHRHVAQVGFEDPEPLDTSDFVASVHSRGHHEWFGTAHGRRSQTESADSKSPAITLCGSVALVDRRKPWHAPIAHLFGAGLGYKLMRHESDILISVITNLFQMPLPSNFEIIPLHKPIMQDAIHLYIIRTLSRNLNILLGIYY